MTPRGGWSGSSGSTGGIRRRRQWSDGAADRPDFWAEWCGPCQAIAPVLEELAEASEGRVTLMKVNVDENLGLSARYGIQSTPTILFVKQDKVVDRVIGAVPKAELQDVLNARA